MSTPCPVHGAAPALSPLRITVVAERLDGSYRREIILDEGAIKVEEVVSGEGRTATLMIAGKPTSDLHETMPAPKGRPS